MIMFRPQPVPPAKPDFCIRYISPQYQAQVSGKCRQGNYIKVLTPQNLYSDQQGYKKAVIYLHGFALGASEIYESHLQHLVKQGFYVFYPVYQSGFCQVQWKFWSNIAEIYQAILNPCPINAEGWMTNAIASVKDAYTCNGLLDKQVHSYLFGHSLGGLQALSWDYYTDKVLDSTPAQLKPQQVLAVDPIPSSDSNIPQPIRFFVNRFGLLKNTVRIQNTGCQLNVPVAILHGDSDSIVKLKDWKQMFHYINSQQKRLYTSCTDKHGSPYMSADHMQATVYTYFLPNWMAKSIFGGVGTEDNLNWRYIWSALDQVIRGEKRADDLCFCMGTWSDGKKVKSIVSVLPENSVEDN
ncbi:hypothetical protein Xen7305DRAFT_00014750 [Xenococcus sp. PCC 7305]|nr:hypothetical protein Xen7305DRAFT_00014750 [Xenococcus sp. PCC 7305]